MATFRVHYQITSLVSGSIAEHRDVKAPTPDAAATQVVNQINPRPISIRKVKKLREGMDA